MTERSCPTCDFVVAAPPFCAEPRVKICEHCASVLMVDGKVLRPPTPEERLAIDGDEHFAVIRIEMIRGLLDLAQGRTPRSRPEPNLTQSAPTAKQLKFLASLAEERGVNLDLLAVQTKREASELISQMKLLPVRGDEPVYYYAGSSAAEPEYPPLHLVTG